MAATELDDDAWLYGDDTTKLNDHGDVNAGDAGRSDSPLLDDLDDVIVNVGVQQKPTNKIVSVTNNLQPKIAAPDDTKTSEDDGVFEQDAGRGGEGKMEVGEGANGSQETEGGGEEEEEEEEEEESESDEDDVQIHIGPIDTQPAPFHQGWLPPTSSASLAGQTKVDLEAIPQIGGQSLYEIDLDSADKPWRLPGADITDYFNYGFTEETWRLYCERQRKTKAEVIQLNKIAVHTTRIVTLPNSNTITSLSAIPSIGHISSLPPPIHFPLPPAGLPLPPNLLPPLRHMHGVLPPTMPEPPQTNERGTAPSHEEGDDGKTPEPESKEEASDGRATPGVDQDVADVLPQGKLPLLPPPPSSLAHPPFSMPPPGLRTSTSAGADVAAMAAMFGGLRPPDGPFPNFPLPPPGFPPPFHPQLPGSDFRPRPPFHGGPPPFPLLPGGPIDVPGMLHPHVDDRGIPIHPDLLPGGAWDPSMGPPPPELFEMMARREGLDYPRGSRSPSRSGSSAHSRSRSRSSSYDDRGKGTRRREKRARRHSRSRSHSRDRDRDRDRDRHARSSRRHRTNHHRTERHERDRDRDRDREREREREKERERDRRRREDRSRRDRSRRHRSSSRDREEERASTASRGSRDRKPKDSAPREERSHSRTPT